MSDIDRYTRLELDRQDTVARQLLTAAHGYMPPVQPLKWETPTTADERRRQRERTKKARWRAKQKALA